MKYSLYYSKSWIPNDENKIEMLDNTLCTSTDQFKILDNCETADFAILPFFLNREKYCKYYTGLREIVKNLKKFHKRLIVFYINDDNDLLDLENTIMFRPGLYKSQKRAHEYPCPHFSEDLCCTEAGNKVHVVKRENLFSPIVGFCGDTNVLFAGQETRNHVLAKLIESRWCRTNFLLRTGFYFHQSEEQKLRNRREYIENLLESEYCLAVRGAGNFSIRFYEICCLGKIPVFIDTDCWIPFDHMIEYRNLFVWINRDEVGFVGEKLNYLNRALSDSEYRQRCLFIRKIWLQYFSMRGFFNHMGRYLIVSK